MNPRPCPSCNSHFCDRIDCYTTEPEHDDEETISKLTLDECRKLFANPLELPEGWNRVAA